MIIFGMAYLAVAQVTRLGLTLVNAREVTCDYTLILAHAIGLVFDLAVLGMLALPWILILPIMPINLLRSRGCRVLIGAALYMTLVACLFGAAAEWLFWQEFGTRFNFIAVDYLVYTTEVIGNIRESYPLGLIFSGIFAMAAIGMYPLLRAGWITAWQVTLNEPLRRGWLRTGVLAATVIALGSSLSERLIPYWVNNYNRELARNGVWALFAAFRANQLDYDSFYPVVPVAAAFTRLADILPLPARFAEKAQGSSDYDLLRQVENDPGRREERWNVIQITVESLSAEFLQRYGGTAGLTPNLDALLPQALVFDNFYATGNRTDRGMEALTLSVPPTPGRSLVKRPGNENLFSLGSIFQGRGYATAFIYGGYGYFDNMNHFFGGNGYQVIDRAKVAPKAITFANAWGACDEDVFNWVIDAADDDFRQGRPFHYFVMTTSNHRPFTYPEGRIDLPSKAAGRAGGVKYTDYAIGAFLHAAAAKPWYRDTLFVIVADHCASSAGQAALPIDLYHIPLLVYAPGGQVRPGVVPTLMSQIDYAPTLLSLLNWRYSSRFYGRDVLHQDSTQRGRALIANYQQLGLFDGRRLAVLKPVREQNVFAYEPDTRALADTDTDTHAQLLLDTIAYYQTASWLLRHERQGALPAGLDAN